MPRIFLGVNKQVGGVDTPVSKIELQYGVSSGVTLRALGHGLVSLFEEHTARLERGLSISEWIEMDETEKALIIAARRVKTSILNLQSEAEIRKAEQDAKRRK